MHIAPHLAPNPIIGGIVEGLEQLPQHPDPVDVYSITARLRTLVDGLEEGAAA